MLKRPVRGRKAWRRATLRRQDWFVEIPDNALDEIAAVIETLRANPVPTIALDAGDYRLNACRRLMRRVHAMLDDGAGFAVLDRLPLDRYTKDELTAVYWLLSGLIARPVAQAFDGTLLYDVHDTGRKIATRVRGDKTRQKLAWHTDYGFNHPSPYIGLLVLRTSKSGGESRVVSLATIHNEMRRRCPDLLARLYRPYYWNRQGEHAPGDPITNVKPIFRYDGTLLSARVNRRLLQVGHELMDEPMDEDGAAALEALYALMDQPELNFDFVLEAGQIQYLNNWRCAHQREDYIDYDEPDKRRHLVRIFLRDEGARSYMG
jgi:alpha-ketoglutarate-dependent taurine dioxygenase